MLVVSGSGTVKALVVSCTAVLGGLTFDFSAVQQEFGFPAVIFGHHRYPHCCSDSLGAPLTLSPLLRCSAHC